ncbi:MAG: Glu-tRNA(Gln) amidotransferase subunit GatD [Deltaproteobacteria bacterium]|nr:Glu-tRNA(Gln) amidotransferase subunit GatD [Deltaproteobacteria bacterium]
MSLPFEERADRFQGYREPARSVMERLRIGVWSEVELVNDSGSVFTGVILPRSETADPLHVVVKLINGYNVGVHADRIVKATETGYKKAVYKIPEKDFPRDPLKKNVTLLGTGGTIASRLDYRTGAVIPAFTPGELYGAVPELADIANLTTKKLFGVFSENMGPEQYKALAIAIGEEIERGTDGIVVGHGTDTMSHTGAILSFMVQQSPVPIVLVGSQRSSDRPSSDAALNLMNAVRTAAECDIAEVMLCMFGPTSDKYDLLHRGTRCRKMHSSYRSTFRTVGATPLAMVSRDLFPDGSHFQYINQDFLRRDKARKPVITPVFEEKVTIQYYYPNFQPDIIDGLSDMGYRGLVMAGTGLGHVNKPIYPALKRAVARGMTIVMCVQTLWGYAQMYVYDTGRDLLDIGLVPLDNMLPETAYMKLAWVLGQTDDPARIRQMMTTSINHEITPREPHNGYLILQGGLPEVEAFVNKHWK